MEKIEFYQRSSKIIENILSTFFQILANVSSCFENFYHGKKYFIKGPRIENYRKFFRHFFKF